MANKVESIYISSGCNKCPKALDWGGKHNQLIAGVSNSVALFSNEEPFEIKCTFNKHTDRVNCVKWISPADDDLKISSLKCNEFISASKDKSLVLWQGNDFEYDSVQTLNGHTDNICVIDGMYYADTKSNEISTLLASASVDSSVRIWSRNSDYNLDKDKSQFTQDQVIMAKSNGFALALKFYILPISKLPLLLIGYDNNKIEINIRLHNEKDQTHQFYTLHTLIGHEDWIRDIDICQMSTNQLLIASSSQDNYIRLWKLDSSLVDKKEELNTDLIIEGDTVEGLEKLKLTNYECNEDEEIIKEKPKEEELKLKSSLFTVHSSKLNNYVQYSMNLESVLYGHEDWIYTVKFHPRINGIQPLVLLSASIDKTMVVWKYDENNNIWIDQARAGDIGGNTLGFYGATFDQKGKNIVAHGYQGALHLWKLNLENQSLVPGIINGGHFDLVEDICWEPEQNFFISTSKDQTTRFHGVWLSEKNSPITWHELGRPQIHGYDLKCCAFLDRFKFVSGADEKLLRVFEAPKIFLNNLHKLCLDESYLKLVQESTTMPQGASIPALGLSNKAVFDEEKKATTSTETDKKSLADELYKEVYFNVIDLKKPPTEEHLLQNTLWPEMQKLYGHGFELFSLAVDVKNKMIASSCKAAKAEHADIILWQEQYSNNQSSFKQIDSLKGHELTIVQMKFSNDSNYLLSVSRDRSWKLFRRQIETNNNTKGQLELFRSISSKNSYHTRIIWSCDWSHDDKYFVTTSRDKKACIWYGSEGKNSPEEKPVTCKGSDTSILQLESAITACAFAPETTSDNQYLLAFGLECGKIEFYTWSVSKGFEKYAEVERRFTHHLTVNRLSFRKSSKTIENSKHRSFCLASCSNDKSVRLFELTA